MTEMLVRPSGVEAVLSDSAELPLYPVRPEIDRADMVRVHHETRHERWNGRFKRVLGSVALGIFLGAGVFATGMQRDIEQGQERVADAHSSIHTIYTTTDLALSDTATIVATGFNTKDSSSTAQVLTPYRSIGDIYALDYSNKDINIDELTKTVETLLKRDEITYVNFDGFSAGGPIELAIAAKLSHDMPKVQVVSVALNSSPVGKDSLTQASADAADVLQSILRYDSDLVYSSKARLAAEVIARHSRYQKADFPYVYTAELEHEIEDVYETKSANPDGPSGSLDESQLKFLESGDIDPSLRQLADMQDRPLLYYTRAVNAAADAVVRDDNSEANLQAEVSKYHIPFESIHIEGIGHANPVERPTEYSRTTEALMIPEIQAAIQNRRINGQLVQLAVRAQPAIVPAAIR